MAGQTFNPRVMDEARLKELLGPKPEAVMEPTMKLLTDPPKPAARDERRPLATALEAVGTAGLYIVMTIFTAELLGSQGVGWISGIMYALGGIFEIVKITLIYEGVRRKSIPILLVAALFMVVSTSGAALNLLASWQAKVAQVASDPILERRDGLKRDMEAIRASIDADTARLKAGEFTYWGEPNDIRKAVKESQDRLNAKEKELASLPEPAKGSSVQGAKGFFGSLSVLNIDIVWIGRLEVIFRLIIALALEAGGFTGVVLLVRRK
jgi:hypothetical protein